MGPLKLACKRLLARAVGTIAAGRTVSRAGVAPGVSVVVSHIAWWVVVDVGLTKGLFEALRWAEVSPDRDYGRTRRYSGYTD